MAKRDAPKIDQLLDLLLDALQERQAARGGEQPAISTQRVEKSFVDEVPEPVPAQLPASDQTASPPIDEAADQPAASAPDTPEKLPTIHLDRMLGRLVIVLLLIIVLINIPFNRYGTNLARAMPDRQALVIRDGLLLKGEGDEIYVLEDNHKRWISSLDAFEYYGYRWEEVNLVDDAFLDQFPSGPALSILYKCSTSPHVYAIENGYKRWIKDIPTFTAEGYVWDDVQMVPCSTLEKIPSGPPIPPDAGEPPTL